MDKPPSVRIENIVASASVGQRIDLNLILKAFPDVEYQPSLFPGLVFRLKKPKTATLIFKTGKMVCTGAKSEEAARIAVNKVVKALRRHGIVKTKELSVKIQNIVACAELEGPVDLEKLVYKLRKTMYEPEQFPGVVYRMDDPKVVFLIFSTGKVVCVGAKKEKHVYEAVEKLGEILRKNELIVTKREGPQ